MDSSYRLLLDPTSTDGGGGGGGGGTDSPSVSANAPPTTQATTQAAPPPPPQSPPPPPPVKTPDVSLPWDTAQQLFAAERRLREIEADKQKEIAEKDSQRLLAVAQKEGAEKALAEQRTFYEGKISKLEDAFYGALKSGEIANATASITFVSPEAASQARAIMTNRLEIRQDGDGVKIVDRQTGRPAAEAVRGWLETAEFKHFQSAGSRGGTGGGNSDLTTHQEAPPPAKSFADRAIEYHQQVNAQAVGGRNPYDPLRVFEQFNSKQGRN